LQSEYLLVLNDFHVIVCPMQYNAWVRIYKKLSYCWETVRRESMPRIAEMDVEMTA